MPDEGESRFRRWLVDKVKRARWFTYTADTVDGVARRIGVQPAGLAVQREDRCVRGGGAGAHPTGADARLYPDGPGPGGGDRSPGGAHKAPEHRECGGRDVGRRNAVLAGPTARLTPEGSGGSVGSMMTLAGCGSCGYRLPGPSSAPPPPGRQCPPFGAAWKPATRAVKPS